MTDKEIRSAIEAILFANGGSVTTYQLAQSIEVTESVIKTQAEELIKEYKELDRGITIIKLNKSFQMVSQKTYAPQIRKAMDLRRNIPLSQAALEVLAVIAYNQPVTKNFIEQVRGVDCAGVIGSLTSKDLIEEKGRLELPGRPLLYGTTENFLRCFSLEGLEDLPALPTSDDEDTSQEDEEKEKELSVFQDEENTLDEKTEGVENEEKDIEESNKDSEETIESGEVQEISQDAGDVRIDKGNSDASVDDSVLHSDIQETES